MSAAAQRMVELIKERSAEFIACGYGAEDIGRFSTKSNGYSIQALRLDDGSFRLSATRGEDGRLMATTVVSASELGWPQQGATT